MRLRSMESRHDSPVSAVCVVPSGVICNPPILRISNLSSEVRKLTNSGDWRSGPSHAALTGYSTVSDDTHSLPESIPVWYPNPIECLIEPMWMIQRIRSFTERMNFLAAQPSLFLQEWARGSATGWLRWIANGCPMSSEGTWVRTRPQCLPQASLNKQT